MSVNENIPVSKACIGLKDQTANKRKKKVVIGTGKFYEKI